MQLLKGSKIRIGILGGSFDPAHKGHLYISNLALKKLNLDGVMWLVTKQNPLKKTSSPFEKRYESALAFASNRIIVSDFERHLNSPYTYNVVKLLKTKFPKTEFIWIMSTDNLAQFHKWKNWKKLASLLPIVIFSRGNNNLSSIHSKAGLYLRKMQNEHFKIILHKRITISSTELRAQSLT